MSWWTTIANVLGLNRVSVYVTMGDVNFTRASGKLQDAGILFWIKMLSSSSDQGTPDGSLTEYEIFVRREDAQDAKDALGVD